MRTAIVRPRDALRKTTRRTPTRATLRRTALRDPLQHILAGPANARRRAGPRRITITIMNRAALRVVRPLSIRAVLRTARPDLTSMQGRAAQANEISIQPHDIAPLSLRRAATTVRRTVRGLRKRAALRLEQPLPLKGAAPRTTLQGRMVPLQLHNHEAGVPAKAKP